MGRPILLFVIVRVMEEEVFNLDGIPNPDGLLPPRNFAAEHVSMTAQQKHEYIQQQVEAWRSETTERMCCNCFCGNGDSGIKQAVVATRFKVIGYWAMTLCQECCPKFDSDGI